MRRERANWVEPSLNGWRFDLEGLSAFIGRPNSVPWLRGKLVAKPEFKSESHTVSGTTCVTAEFTFFITSDDVGQRGGKSMRNQVFISYSHRDKNWLDRLCIHLRPLERQGLVELFDDNKIAAGARWREEIKATLDKAKVAVLLISADFLASDFIAEDELPPLLKKAQSGGATILPVIVSACRFHREKTLSEYQAVNDPKRPLASLTPAESEQVLVAVSEAVEDALENHGRGKEPSDESAGPTQSEKRRAEPKGESAKQLLALIDEEKDGNLKGITEIRDASEPGQTFFLGSLATHGQGKVYKMKSRLFREAIDELLEDKWLYPPENAGGSLLYEFRPE